MLLVASWLIAGLVVIFKLILYRGVVGGGRSKFGVVVGIGRTCGKFKRKNDDVLRQVGLPAQVALTLIHSCKNKKL